MRMTFRKRGMILKHWVQIMVNILKFKTQISLFSNRMMVIKAGIRKILLRLANREDPDQTASSEGVWSGTALFV